MECCGRADDRADQSLAGGLDLHGRPLQHQLTRLFVVAGLVWLSIMIVITSGDYATRHWDYHPQPWGHTKDQNTKPIDKGPLNRRLPALPYSRGSTR